MFYQRSRLIQPKIWIFINSYGGRCKNKSVNLLYESICAMVYEYAHTSPTSSVGCRMSSVEYVRYYIIKRFKRYILFEMKNPFSLC